MTQKEIVFSIEYQLKSMEFACKDDNCYKATFINEKGETWQYTASREDVLEHVKAFARHPELYETNKTLLVTHFHQMAMYNYSRGHFPKSILKTLT